MVPHLCCSKSRRRCLSEGLHQSETDPLKELNRCCDKGCDYMYHSSLQSQNRKTDHKASGEKKLICSDDIEMEVGDYHGIKKHHSRSQKEKCIANVSRSGHFQNVHNELACSNTSLPVMYENNRKTSPGSAQHKTIDKYHLSTPKHERTRSNMTNYCIGDAQGIALPNSKSLSYKEQDKFSSEMRERYMKEMEILRSKLNYLKGEMACDGKRLRQRSESEPGFAGVAGGVPKRARDNSPKLKYGCRKLPPNPSNFHLMKHSNLLNKQNISVKDVKFLYSASKSSIGANKFNTRISAPGEALSLQRQRNRISLKDESSSDSDLEGSICDEELQSHEDADANISEDDDHSILSSATSASTDSNTPSQVGETLGSITLNEAPKKEPQTRHVQEEHSHKNPATGALLKTVPTPKSEYIVKNHNIVTTCTNPFRVSLFSNVPPYVKFFMHDLKGPTLPTDITRHLKWKLSSITPIVIRRTLVNSGFKLIRRSYDQYYNLIYIPPHRTEDTKTLCPSPSRAKRKTPKESNDWTGQWGKHMKSFVFKTLKDFQKLNHFPGTFQIGRKDRLWKNLYRLMVKFGKKEFGFIPKTYILPQDSKLLRSAWEKASVMGKGQWIVKPPAAARGTGIKVVHKWGQIPKKRPLIVQKYIAKPYLINGSKFDLRLYVLMTSIHPLRIYLYDDGLVRFASVKYSEDVECLSDRFMHLTNYSINKLSSQYCANEDASSCRGHKWTLKALWTYFGRQGINVKALKKNLIDLVIKTIISGESNINILTKNNLPSRYCSYELFGIDVLLDHSLKPWLLEVNISPSLHSASPLDLAVKGPLVRELLNIAGFQIPSKLSKEQEDGYMESFGLKDKIHSLCYDKRIYWTTLSKEERLKHETFSTVARDEYLSSILEELTPDDVRHLIQFEDELTQLGRFEKVFPTPKTHVYHQYFESPRYYNMMLDAWETKYHKNRSEGIRLLESLCQKKLHLIVPFPGSKMKTSQSQSDVSSQTVPEGETEIESDTETISTKSPEQGETEKSPDLASGAGEKKSKLKGRPASMISKPIMRVTFGDRRGRIGLSNAGSTKTTTETIHWGSPEAGGDPQFSETCLKFLAEMQNSNPKTAHESKSDVFKHYQSCKLENSLVHESLSSGKNIISPSKSIKMNISS